MSAKRFDEKIAIVTGAAQGIGRATALRLAAEGAVVLLADRAVAQLAEVCSEIEQLGGRAAAVNVDLETPDGAHAMVDRALALFGRIDVAVHNVGGTIWMKPFWEYTHEEMEKEISRSLWPALWCCREVIPVMKAQGRGSIVNVGSVATRGIYRVPYAAAKGGVHAMTVCIAAELAEHGVRANCVSPGGVDVGQRVIPRNTALQTERDKGWLKSVADQTLRDTPMKRFGTPQELAAAICFFASDEASYITGEVVFVSGGGIG
ncbi:1,6-dihydroxycyclohexa-2,4-diene-1-carboxylate dehydrogenase [Paraburkholderia fungorum]|uniref:1,6-dihydroxycyclohexa-2,4-diene-1-carboxylate dehydrogenase n=1 Tax=Paraburkholderia fungorum TaxID=134537 RepID=A0AAP5UZ43_9BURK|nr:1,6-dihydroxycyclohexa-2,4-diene-1-carboxylate dehydrogenase [Paraburkholderia fungorum]MBU7436234.1 1,6-dihydroxycyclohexa-2,4-diene-1-carboxylate dehydrogenase [Paraburkholderia fungorum]MDT8843701.1 1,6-dihydroxycyclohexa-2,4-diene-1-carboxylate dehydrogenase [Paraburkholderia fungorum]PZR45636.1 MAG: 1,6-dihydroxycyclohexa-2,4-diene-1-carboxylate dehydrogenase [Paraburkholderia fungorum]